MMRKFHHLALLGTAICVAVLATACRRAELTRESLLALLGLPQAPGIVVVHSENDRADGLVFVKLKMPYHVFIDLYRHAAPFPKNHADQNPFEFYKKQNPFRSASADNLSYPPWWAADRVSDGIGGYHIFDRRHAMAFLFEMSTDNMVDAWFVVYQ